jgi:hypothetical protein
VTPPITINERRSRLQPQLDQFDFTWPALEPSHHTSLHIFSSFSMAPTKAPKKKAPSKTKATQAKGKENAASTAALQDAKKKNHPRTTAAASAAEEIEQLKGQFLLIPCAVCMETHMSTTSGGSPSPKGEGKCCCCSHSGRKDRCNPKTQRRSRVQGV